MIPLNTPAIVRFQDLGHEWRRVARKRDGDTVWEGDLHDKSVRDAYLQMVADGVVHCLHGRDGNGWAVYAAIRRCHDVRPSHLQAQERARRPLSRRGDTP